MVQGSNSWRPTKDFVGLRGSVDPRPINKAGRKSPKAIQRLLALLVECSCPLTQIIFGVHSKERRDEIDESRFALRDIQ